MTIFPLSPSFGESWNIQNQTIWSWVSKTLANSIDQNQSVWSLSKLIESVSADTHFNIETIVVNGLYYLLTKYLFFI